MTQKRINPDTGRIEERHTVLGGLGGDYWVPKENESGNQERIDPKTGRYEERETFLGGLAGFVWVAKESKQRNAGRSDTGPDSGGGTESERWRTSTDTIYGSSSPGSGSSASSEWSSLVPLSLLTLYQAIAILLIDNPLPRFAEIFASDSWVVLEIIGAALLFLVGVFVHVCALFLHPLFIFLLMRVDGAPFVAQIFFIYAPTYPVLIWAFLRR